MRASMKRHGTPAHHRKQHASRLKRRVLLVVLLLLFILCGPLITHPRRRETRRGGARNMHFTLQGRLAFTPVEPTQPLQHQYQHQHHQAMSAGAKESRNGGQHALSEGLELPVGHHNAEGLFASHTCKAANDNDAKDGTIVRVLFRRSRCRRWGPEGTQDGLGTECNEVSRPIVELSPRASAAAYFPEEALADEADGYKRPSQLRSVVTEEEEEEEYEEGQEENAERRRDTLWRTSASAPATLRCVPRGNGVSGHGPHWVWNSSNFLVHFTLRSGIAPQQLGSFYGNFSFSVKHQVHFYGMPSRPKGLRLPSDARYDIFNQFSANPSLSPETVLSGSVPFVYAIGRVPKPHGSTTATTFERRAVGILWLNGSPLKVRTASGGQRGWTSISFTSTAGATRVYLLPGPTPEDVLLQYYALTGFPMMPPLFALGYHHTHRSYKEAKTLLDLSAAFAREQIPVDTLGLGLNHTNGKHIFTWNRVHFPDPVEMQQQLWRDGGRFLVLSTVPYVSADPRFALYLEGRRHEYFVTAHPEEDDLFMGLTATGLMTWVDFLNPGARRWYGGLLKYKRFVGSTNHTFFSLEENEPFVPNGMRETLPAESGHAGAVPHSEVHNIYGMLHAMTVYKGQLRRTHFHRRPFVMTQSFFAGVQRYAAVRLGHTTASWEHLQASVEGCLMHSIAGIPFVGTDIGGFFHQPDDELLVRWYQLGAFYPLFRADADAAVPLREAWLFAAHTRARIRDAVRLRYTLLPYLYTLFWRAHVHGELILRPLFFVYQQDPLVYVEPAMLTQRFFFGPHLFVAPIVTPAVGSSAPKMLQMPAEELYNFWTGELVASGAILQVSQKLSTSKSPEEKDIVPLFQRVGAILPTFTDVSGMRSTHDAANYTLTITLPRLLPLVISPSLPSRGVNSTLLLAQGELFVDGGSSYVDYHNLNGTRRVACVLAFECSLLPNRSYLQVQWRTTASSSCGEVLDELRGTSVGVSGPDAFLITRLRLLFATPDDSERVVGGGRATGGDGQELSLLKVSDHLVEVLGLAVPLLTNYGGDEDDNNSNGNVPRLVAAMRLG